MPPRRAEAPSGVITLRMSPEERERLLKAARANHQRPSDFARDAIVTAAEDVLEDDSSHGSPWSS